MKVKCQILNLEKEKIITKHSEKLILLTSQSQNCKGVPVQYIHIEYGDQALWSCEHLSSIQVSFNFRAI